MRVLPDHAVQVEGWNWRSVHEEERWRGPGVLIPGGCTHTHITLCLFKAGGAQVGGGDDAGQGGEAQVVSVGVLGDGVALLSPTRGSDPALAVARRPPYPLRADAPFARPTQVLVPRGGSAGRAEPRRSRRDAVWWRHGWRACDSLLWPGTARWRRAPPVSHIMGFVVVVVVNRVAQVGGGDGAWQVGGT